MSPIAYSCVFDVIMYNVYAALSSLANSLSIYVVKLCLLCTVFIRFSNVSAL